MTVPHPSQQSDLAVIRDRRAAGLSRVNDMALAMLRWEAACSMARGATGTQWLPALMPFIAGWVLRCGGSGIGRDLDTGVRASVMAGWREADQQIRIDVQRGAP